MSNCKLYPNIKTKRGASLIWTVILSGVLIFIASSISTSAIAELKMSSRIDDSARAYAAAESGIEYGRFYIEGCSKNNTCSTKVTNDHASNTLPKTIEITEPNGKTQYVVDINPDPSNPTNLFVVNSRGTANSVNRELEYKINATAVNSTLIPNSDAVNSVNTGTPRYAMENSVEIQFDYWMNANTTHNIFGFTDGATPNPNDLYLSYDNSTGKMYLNEHHSGITYPRVEVASPSSYNFANNTSRIFLIKLSYIKNTVFSVTVYERDTTTYIPKNCVGSGVMDLTTVVKPDNMTRLYMGPNTTLTNPDYSSAQNTSITINSAGKIDAIFQKGISAARTLTVTKNILGGHYKGGGSYVVSADGNQIGTCDETCYASGANPIYYVKDGAQITITGSPDPYSNLTTTPATMPFNVNTNPTPNVEFYSKFTPTDCSLGGCAATVVSVTGVPSSMMVGETATVTVVMRNTGTKSWNNLNPSFPFSLGSQNPQDNTTWGTGRKAVTNPVDVNQTFNFTFTMRAPLVGGNYNFQWRMVQDGKVWFGTSTTNLVVNVIDPWISGPVAGIKVYYTDTPSLQWKTTNTKCASPQCIITGSQDYLNSDNSVNFNEYPLRDYCKALGGRVPSQGEMSNILQNLASYGNNFTSATYWTSIESPYNWTNYQQSGVIQRNPYTNGSNIATPKASSYPTRCIK